MLSLDVLDIKSGGPQIGVFCLVVELGRGGFAITSSFHCEGSKAATEWSDVSRSHRQLN